MCFWSQFQRRWCKSVLIIGIRGWPPNKNTESNTYILMCWLKNQFHFFRVTLLFQSCGYKELNWINLNEVKSKCIKRSCVLSAGSTEMRMHEALYFWSWDWEDAFTIAASQTIAVGLPGDKVEICTRPRGHTEEVTVSFICLCVRVYVSRMHASYIHVCYIHTHRHTWKEHIGLFALSAAPNYK